MNIYTPLLHKTVRVNSYRGDNVVRAGKVTKVAVSKNDSKPFFVVDSGDGHYHTFKPDGSPEVVIIDAE